MLRLLQNGLIHTGESGNRLYFNHDLLDALGANS